MDTSYVLSLDDKNLLACHILKTDLEMMEYIGTEHYMINVCNRNKLLKKWIIKYEYSWLKNEFIDFWNDYFQNKTLIQITLQ